MAAEIMSLEDQARLELTLRTREQIIRSLTSGGQLPKEAADRAFLSSALDGMDRTILSRAKIKSDDANAKTEADIARDMANVLMRVEANRKTRGRPIDVEAVELPEITLVEGEISTGTHPVKTQQLIQSLN